MIQMYYIPFIEALPVKERGGFTHLCASMARLSQGVTP